MLQYALPIFLGAFLLFQVQPLIARCLLPWFGGMPAVWTTCMLFFQVLLLGGYAYAHWLATRLRSRGQALLQGAVLALSLALLAAQWRHWGGPLIPAAAWKPADPDAPVRHLLLLLAVTVGLPYFVLATTSPLLQAWCSRARPGVAPYRLYMLSNAGSLLALLTYPVLIEPALALRAQAAVWAVIFVVFAATYLLCAVRSASGSSVGAVTDRDPETVGAVTDRDPETVGAVTDRVPETVGAVTDRDAETVGAVTDRDAAPPALAADAGVSWRHRILWIVLPALASTLLLAVTNQICQELAVIPFLWVLPLTLYLLSFIICFGNPRWYVRAVYLPAMLTAVPVVAYVMTQPLEMPVRWQIADYAALLFCACMFCHGEVVARRPDPRHLTTFYLAISIGGALGGLFVGLLAPLIFVRFYELHVALLACWLAGLVAVWRWRLVPADARGYVLAALLTLSIGLPVIYRLAHHSDRPPIILAHRSFYGVFRVEDRDRDRPGKEVHSLVHGATIHGLQYLDPSLRHRAMSYYSPRSGVGLAVTRHPRYRSPHGGAMRIGVVGLGTGNMAVYGRVGDTVRFYEINPAVDQMAHDAEYFSYLADSPAHIEVALGDARLSLERELRQSGSQQFDVLALDAFSSDSIPAHLLTREAFAIYLQHLRPPDGVLAVHVSNRFLDLGRVVYGLADACGLQALRFSDPGGPGIYKSDWMLLTSSPRVLTDREVVRMSLPRPATRPLRLWTDDYYNLWQILR